MRTTTTCTGNQKLFDEFTDLTLVCLPDDDDRFDGVPAQSVVASGNKLFVRESEWPTLREMLKDRSNDGEAA